MKIIYWSDHRFFKRKKSYLSDGSKNSAFLPINRIEIKLCSDYHWGNAPQLVILIDILSFQEGIKLKQLTTNAEKDVEKEKHSFATGDIEICVDKSQKTKTYVSHMTLL